jgi:hypothetical protein
MYGAMDLVLEPLQPALIGLRVFVGPEAARA